MRKLKIFKNDYRLSQWKGKVEFFRSTDRNGQQLQQVVQLATQLGVADLTGVISLSWFNSQWPYYYNNSKFKTNIANKLQCGILYEKVDRFAVSNTARRFFYTFCPRLSYLVYQDSFKILEILNEFGKNTSKIGFGSNVYWNGNPRFD